MGAYRLTQQQSGDTVTAATSRRLPAYWDRAPMGTARRLTSSVVAGLTEAFYRGVRPMKAASRSHAPASSGGVTSGPKGSPSSVRYSGLMLA